MSCTQRVHVGHGHDALGVRLLAANLAEPVRADLLAVDAHLEARGARALVQVEVEPVDLAAQVVRDAGLEVRADGVVDGLLDGKPLDGVEVAHSSSSL